MTKITKKSTTKEYNFKYNYKFIFESNMTFFMIEYYVKNIKFLFFLTNKNI